SSEAHNINSQNAVVVPTSGSADPGDDGLAVDSAVAALVERAVRRDQAAFAELYELFLGPLYRYAYFRVGNRTDAEDLAETLFVQAWAAIERFRWQGKPFVAWL